ncbi:MAG: hypothetical protein RMJ56_04315 [Gemmataceae bacterium]|nr:hypothetical protein [Gemmata sp.]MDW8196813.1 hypothetical protein [Gemmataceae bacterium]
MNDTFLALLRCPFDPHRQTPLSRHDQFLVCDRCQVRFPIKHGLPVLVTDEAEWPPGIRHAHQLPCQQQQHPSTESH